MVPNKFDGYDILLQSKVSPGRYIVLGTRSKIDHATFIYDEQTEQFTKGCYFGSIKRACNNYTIRKDGETRAYQNKIQKAKKMTAQPLEQLHGHCHPIRAT
jgi:hypothetical protein